MALTAFRRIQIGKETVRGTEVDATKKLPGTLVLTNQIQRYSPVDERNSLAEFRRDVDIAQQASLRYEGAATYQQILDFLLMGVTGGVAGVQEGVTTAYGWTFAPTLTVRQNQNSYTFEYGDNTQAWVSVFTMLKGFELGFTLGEVVMLRADLFSRFATKSTFKAGIADPTVNEIVANKLSVWIDGTWANLGTTIQSSLVLGGVIRLSPTGVVPIKYADNSLDFSTFMEQRRHLEIELEMAVGSVAITEYDAWAALTDRAIRLKFSGPTLEGGVHSLIINAIGRYVVEPVIFDGRDGQDIIRLVLHTREDASGNEFSFVGRTNVAAV